MNVEKYLEQRRRREEAQPSYRELCLVCLQPCFSCYCRDIQRFDPGMQFVILNHPLEMRRRFATGRMSHLCLEQSSLIVGHDYSEDDRVNEILQREDAHAVILYPGPRSLNLSLQTPAERSVNFPVDRQLVVFVIDGTWATARQTARRSRNLTALPRICFTPPRPSNFRVRRQPREECFSTIEAIHHTIELLGDGRGFSTASRVHDRLLHVFDRMVERQLHRLSQDDYKDLSPRERPKTRTMADLRLR